MIKNENRVYLTKAEREELKVLSVLVFGKSSKYQSLFELKDWDTDRKTVRVTYRDYDSVKRILEGALLELNKPVENI